tara:strand:+ start:555 stop:2609 length:2055 start_codon:yes stop_codon:yes gene_type:complete
MKIITKKYLLILLFIFLVSCSLDTKTLTNPNLPSWTTQLEVPLSNSIISFDEIMSDIDDTSIIKIPHINGTNQDSILYAFQDTIIKDPNIIELDTGIDPAYDGMIDSMGTITLDNIPETETPKFLLREINSSLSNGSVPSLPAFSLLTIEKDFTFEDFTEATFQSGSLDITINNQLPFDLENIRVKLKNQENGNYIDSTTIDLVGSKQTGKGIILLTGKTLPKNILVEVDGESPGSSNTVNIDIDNDYFIVIINGTNLIVNQAIVSKIPIQESIIDSGSISLSSSDNKLASASFNKGSLRIKIDSEFDLSITLNMEIKNIQNASNQYDTWQIDLARKSSIDTTFILNEKKLVLYNGNNFDEFLDIEQSIEYFYNIKLEEVTGEIENDDRTINASDKIDISFSFYGDETDSLISFSQITGKIKEISEDIGPINQSPPELPEAMDDLLLIDEYIEMALDIKMSSNTIPIILNMLIYAESLDSTYSSEIINWDISTQGSYIKIPQAANLINIRPETITVTGSAVVGNDNDFTTINVVDSISMQSNFIINIPFVFKVAEGTKIELDPTLTESNEIPSEIKSMMLFVNYDNQFGFGSEMMVLAAQDTLYFADSSSISPDTLIQSLLLDNSTEGKDTIILDETKMLLFENDIYLKTNVNLFGDEIFFLSTDSLILKLSGAIEYLINSNSN